MWHVLKYLRIQMMWKNLFPFFFFFFITVKSQQQYCFGMLRWYLYGDSSCQIQYIKYNTYLINHSSWALFRANERQSKKRQNTTTTVKIPNWPEASQFAFYKCNREDEPVTTRIKFNEFSERVLIPRTPDLKASVLTSAVSSVAPWI